MEDTQRDIRVVEDATPGQQADESRAREATTTQLGRLLANPRRVRRA